jgi:hypothetical protein
VVLGVGLAVLGIAPALGGAFGIELGSSAVAGDVPALAIALLAAAVASGGSLVVEVASTTLFQRVVPDRIRGRALGVTETITMLAYTAGSLVLPIAASVAGIAPVLGVSAAIVVAGAVVGVALIPREALQQPSTGVDELAERLPGRTVFAGIPPVRLATALARARSVDVAANEAVIREGDPADTFFVIRDGRFAVSQGGRAIRTLGPDDVFGELGLLNGEPRTATVTAESDGRLLALGADDFLDLVAAAPDLRPRLLALYRGRPAVR